MKAKQMEGQWVAEMTKRRELHNQLQDMVGSLRVACRVRPIKGDDTAITIKDPSVASVLLAPVFLARAEPRNNGWCCHKLLEACDLAQAHFAAGTAPARFACTHTG